MIFVCTHSGDVAQVLVFARICFDSFNLNDSAMCQVGFCDPTIK